MKRITSLLLALLLLFTLLAGQGFAARNGVKAIQLVKKSGGTAALDNLAGAQASSLWFGGYIQSGRGRDAQSEPVEWRLLENAEGQLLLLADKNLEARAYHSAAESVAWNASGLRDWLNDGADGFIGSAFTETEAAALAEADVSDPAPGRGRGEAAADRVFLLSAAEVQNEAYGFTDAKSRAAENTAHAAGQGADGSWWLRTPGGEAAAAIVEKTGEINSTGKDVTDSTVAVRPAARLSLDAVLFASAAEGGKASGRKGPDALQKVGDYTGNAWKLTLLDSSRTFAVAEQTISGKNGETVELNYTGATPFDSATAPNEFISAIITDNSGSALFYGRLAQPTAADGKLEITLPSADLLPAGSYELFVFSEQYNGSGKTDYASAFAHVALTVTGETHTIRFLNEDGTFLATVEVEHGKTPVYPNEAPPTKPATEMYTYSFAGWDPPLTAATGDATYRATYEEHLREYTVKFVNENGQTLWSESVAYGVTPEYQGPTPTMGPDAQYTYEFASWTPSIVPVTEDATYTATYIKTVNEYTITFKGADDKTLQETKVRYGELPEYRGTTPTMEPTDEYEYTFSRWTPELTSVVGDITYTAEFTRSTRKYKIRFISEELDEFAVIEVPYGEIPEYTGETPTKPATEEYTYTFARWEPEPEAVKREATYTAIFTATENVSYAVTEGADGSWVKGTIGFHTVTVKRTPNDDTCFSHYRETCIDGEPVTVDAKAGSTVITFSADVLNKLGIGPHTITVKFDDGEVETTLAVKATADSGSSGGSGGSGGKDGSPYTGGGKALDICIGAACFLGLSLAVVAAFKLKKRRERILITID